MNRLFKTIAIQACVLTSLVILIEVVLWTVFPLSADQSLVQRYTQSIEGIKPEVVYERNRYGLRSTSMRSAEKEEGVIRVLCLGASTTEQSTQSTSDMWCSLLEERLQPEFMGQGVTIQTAAFGGGGIRAMDNARWLYEHFNTLQPDIVISLLGINDLTLNGGPDYQPRSPEEHLKQDSGTLTENCEFVSQLCRRLVSAVKRVKQAYALSKGSAVEWHSDNLPARRAFYQSLPAVNQPNRTHDPIFEFKSAVFWIAEFLAQRKVPMLILGQPVLWKSNMSAQELDKLWFPVFSKEGAVRPPPSWSYSEMSRYNNVQKEVAERYGLQFVNLDQLLPKSTDTYFDDCHFTDWGSERVAELVATPLKKLITNLSKP